MNRSTLLVTAAVAAVAIIAYALWPAGTPSGGADPDNAEQVALGKTVYAGQCAVCHGAKLEGQPNWRRRLPDGGLPAPPHDEGGHTWHHPDGQLFQMTKRGGQPFAPPGFKSNMPGFAESASDAEIWAVLAYIKSRWPKNIRAR